MKRFCSKLQIITLLVAVSLTYNVSYTQKKMIKLAEKDQVFFTPRQLLSLNRINEIQISPDGMHILYNVQVPDLNKDRAIKTIYIMKIDGSDNKKLLPDDIYNNYNAIWSPDGQKIAFLSNKLGDPQIFTMDFPQQRTPEALAAIAGGVSDLKYSPDGNFFTYTKDVKMFESTLDKYPEMKRANVRIYDDLPVRQWDHWLDESVTHLFMIPTKGGKEKDLTKDEKYSVSDYSISPDSKEIVYVSKKVKDAEISTNSDLYLMTIESGVTKNITSGRDGYDTNPEFSPDGQYIAFNSRVTPGFESDRNRLMLYTKVGGKISEITEKLDQWVENYTWAPDSKTIYFRATELGKNPLFKTNLSGEFSKLTSGNFTDGAEIKVSKDGNLILFLRSTFTNPNEIYTTTPNGGEPNRLTSLNDIILQKLKEPKIEERMIASFDGSKVHTWIIYPPGFDPTKKYPMITYCQGGPQSQIDPEWSYRWNLFLIASDGYIVVAPNRRGLPGFGQKWNDAISKDWGGAAMKDILAVTDSISSQPFVDKTKLAAVGASAGGYAAFWLAGNHNGRFSAFIAHCGVFNAESMYGSTEELFFNNWEFGGPYWDSKNKEIYEKNSPHKFVQNWNTPILIITGEKDFRVPYTQSLEAFTAAQTKGIPSKLLVFPNEHHQVMGYQDAFIWHAEFYKWLDKYCKKK